MHKNIPIFTFLLFVFSVPLFASPTDTTISSSGTYCDSVVLFNNTYFVDTVVIHDTVDEDGRAIHYVDTILISHSVHTDIFDTICLNELPYHFISGQIDTTFQTLEAPLSTVNFYFFTQSDCDSVVTLHIKVNPIPELPSVTAVTRCGPGPVSLVPNNTTLCHWYATPSATSYTETDTLVTEPISESTSFFVSNVDMTTGCESGMVEFPVIIYPVPDTVVIYDSVCLGTTYTEYNLNVSYNTAGVKIITLSPIPSFHGCDSVRELHLNVLPPPAMPLVSTEGHCGAGILTLQTVVGQDGTTCYWYDSENSADTIHSGTSFQPELSQTTVFYVSSVNVETGCASARVADTAIIYSVPSSPSVNDAARCGAGPVTLNVTVENPTWTVQWFANDTATDALYTGNQYDTDTLEVSTLPYVYYVQCFDEHCQSSRVPISALVNAIPAEPMIVSGNSTRCGEGIVTLQTVVGQNGTTCYWYDSENSADTIHTGTSFQPELSQTTVFYVSSVNVETGCASARVADTAIIYSVPSSPSVNDAARCGAGPVTLNVTVENPTWTVQWFANDTATDALYTGNQYATDTLEVSTVPYVYYVQSSDEHCQSSRVPIMATVNAIPADPEISGAATNSNCGAGIVTLQTVVGQNGTTCYWYDSENAADTIHTGTSFQPELSQTTVFYVSSVNVETGCASARVADTAIIYSVPSSPSVNDAARCGAGPVTLNVTVADASWTVQWFADSTTADALATGLQYTTNNLDESENPYVYYVQCSDEHCHSRKVPIMATVNAIPTEPEISGDAINSNCGAGIVTLQTVVGQNGTTCYWYDSENAADTIHTGTSFQPELSQTTVFYVSSVNVETGCASVRVADTAIIYSVPSSPSVNDAARCGAGPVTLNVTVEDPSWTVQWFANDTVTELLYTGPQYVTDTLEVSTVPYVYYVQCSDEHCQSSRVMLTVMVNAIPEMYAIIGDTLVCRNQYLEFRYPVEDTENYQYVWYSYFDPDSDSTFGYNIPLWERYIVDSVPQYVIVGMRVQDLQTNCLNDTTLAIHVCEGYSPDRTKVVRKNNSNILICDNSDFPDNIHYRWGFTNKISYDENAFDWDYSYYQFPSLNTIQNRYWVETYVINGGVTCRNRTYYQDDIETGLDQLEQLDVMAYMRGNQLMIQVGNPSEQHTVAVLYDLSGRTIAQWDFGTASVIREQISFGYPNGIYLLTVQVGNRRHTTKILSQQ